MNTGFGSMALAIDFHKLMLEERKKLRNRLSNEGTDRAAQISSSSPMARATAAPLDVHYELPCCPERPSFLGAAQQVADGSIHDVFHIPNFVSPAEEHELMRCVDGASAERWTHLRGRRLQSLGGVPKAPPEMMSREPLPHWVQSICDALVTCGAFPVDTPPNHVLLNEYQPGQGIDAHKDGPLYLDRVCILSLNSQCAFEFIDDEPVRKPLVALLLPPRGVLVFTGDAYNKALHHVPAREEDDAAGLLRVDDGACNASTAREVSSGRQMLRRGRRVSLTVRHVLRSQQAADGFGNASFLAAVNARRVDLSLVLRREA